MSDDTEAPATPETQSNEQPQAEQSQSEGFKGILAEDEEAPEAPTEEAKPKESGFKSVLAEDEEEADAVEGEEGEEKPEEEYVFEYEPPEGIELSEEDLKLGAEFFKEHKIPKELQKPLLDKHLEVLNQSLTDKLTKLVEDTTAPWKEALAKNEEYGGAKVRENARMINKTIREFGGNEDEVKELQQFMRTSPVFDNPLVFGVLTRMSSALSEGGFVSGKPAKPRLTDYQVFTKD